MNNMNMMGNMNNNFGMNNNFPMNNMINDIFQGQIFFCLILLKKDTIICLLGQIILNNYLFIIN